MTPLRGLPISGTTKIAAVIGDPVRHSLSPALHNAAFAEAGLDWVYVALEVARGSASDALRSMRTLGMSGLSITMPHKRDAALTCDELSDDAAALRSVNCVSPLPDGRLRGDSTDGEGFLRSLRDAGVSVDGRTVSLLGAGGAARAVAVALARSGARVIVAARRLEARDEISALAPSIEAVEWGERDSVVADSSLVINSTPLGMLGSAELPCSALSLRREQVIADLVYTPLDTPLLRAARSTGATTVDGLGMLVHQAALAFEIWTGMTPSIEVMRAAACEELASRL